MFFDSDLTRLSIETRKIEDQKPEVQQSFDALQREIREIGGSPDRSEKEIKVRDSVEVPAEMDVGGME